MTTHPESTQAPRKSATRSTGVSRILITAMAAVLVLVIGWFDYVTGDFSMAAFYLVPVAVATWYAGRVSGWFTAVLGAAAWLVGDMAMSHAYGHPLMPYWNAAMLVLLFGTVVQLLAALHRFQTELEVRVARRTASLAKANAELDAARLRFIETEKLETIGRLAAGIAHEVKNPLMTIGMAADYLAQVIPRDDSASTVMIQDLREAITRASRVIGDLLDFARPGALSLQLEDFHEIAERALGLVKLAISKKRIGVIRDWCNPNPKLLLDRNKIEQVLVNVIMNAIQAMPEEGILTVRTHFDAAGLTVEIDDTGPGISPAHQARLFHPFFTTKSLGQGTGLGLSVARQLVQFHEGALGLTNRPEGGARVTIRLPFTTKPQP